MENVMPNSKMTLVFGFEASGDRRKHLKFTDASNLKIKLIL